MKNKVLFVSSYLYLVLPVLSHLHKCPTDQEMPSKINFEMSKYLGEWYQMEGTSSVYYYQMEGVSCVAASYKDVKDEQGRFRARYVETNQTTGLRDVACGYVTPTQVAGRLTVNLPGIWWPIDYRVIDTDYENWAAVYSCEHLVAFWADIVYQDSWLLTRSRSKNQTSINSAKAAFEKNGIDTKDFLQFDGGSNCDYVDRDC